MERTPPSDGANPGLASSKEEVAKQDISVLVRALLGNAAGEVVDSDFRIFELGAAVPVVPLKNLPGLEVRNGCQIRRGASGVVFECWDQELKNRRYALKVQRPSSVRKFLGTALPEAVRQQELARIEGVNTAMLSHQNLIYLVGLSQLEVEWDLTFSVTVSLLEWLEGASSFAKGMYKNCTDLAQFISAAIQVMRGLSHIHSKGLVHWDVKSDNCLFTDDGTLKITDIGNARSLKAKGEKYSEESVA